MYRNFFLKYPAITANLLVGLATLPFANLRIMRHGGDEKVYVAQALEMMSRGEWFTQTLAGDPNYYKGPLHYILLILGTKIFGLQTIATVYMNFALMAIAIAVLVHFARSQLIKSEYAIWLGVTFGLCAGVLPFTFSSQMESELIALYACSLPALYYSRKSDRAELVFWLLAGLAGLSKSPLHALLLGLGGYLYWFSTGCLMEKLTRARSLMALTAGIAVCCAGYFPAFYYDMDNFFNTYVARETLNKSGNRHGWFQATAPIFTYNLFPWILPSIAALGIGIRWFKRVPALHKNIVILALCLATPTMVFFTVHPFRSAIYCVPLMAMVLLSVTIFMQNSSQRYPRLFWWLYAVSFVLLTIPNLFFTYIYWQLNPQNSWWPIWVTPTALGLTVFGLGLGVFALVRSRLSPMLVSCALVPFYLGFLSFAAVLGEGELRDARTVIKRTMEEKGDVEFGFFDLHRHTWNEWGYQNYWVGHKIRGIHDRQSMISFLEAGGIVMVPGEKHMPDVQSLIEESFPFRETQIEPWRRWRSRSDGINGPQLLKNALKERSIAVLEQNYYFVSLKPAPQQVIKTSMKN